MRRYTKTHEWIEKSENGNMRVGISDYAQTNLGDIVYVGAPAIGATVNEGENCAVIESVKAASDIYAPVSGKVATINEALVDNPEIINQDPYNQGWIYEIEDDGQDLNTLLDEENYNKLLSR